MKDLNNIKWALKSSHPKFVEWVQENRLVKLRFIPEQYYHFPICYGSHGWVQVQPGYELITEQEFLEWYESQYVDKVEVKDVKENFKPMEKQITLIPFKHEVWEADKTRKVYLFSKREVTIAGQLPNGHYIVYWQKKNGTFALIDFNFDNLFFSQ